MTTTLARLKRNGTRSRHRRGVTLLVTLLILVLSVTLVSRQALEVTTARLTEQSRTFSVESQWLAQGAAQSWVEASKGKDIDRLLIPAHWTFGAGDQAPLDIQIWPSSVENKLYLPKMDKSRVEAFWQRHYSGIPLAANWQEVLLDAGDAELEVIEAPDQLSAQKLYLNSNGQTPADLLTIWGDGHVDLNRCSPEVLQEFVPSLTLAQVDGIIRLRNEAPLKGLATIQEQLDLSDGQALAISSIAVFAPHHLELVMQIKRGGLSALYHAVVTLGENGEVLEVRPIF